MISRKSIRIDNGFIIGQKLQSRHEMTFDLSLSQWKSVADFFMTPLTYEKICA